MTNTKRLQHLAFTGIVICGAMLLLAGVAIVSESRKKRQAHEQCKYLAKAVKMYLYNPSSTWRPHPTTLNDLNNHPDGRFYLEGGAADLLDPWGKPFQLQLTERPGEYYDVLITTTAPNGTPISQFGIGRNAFLIPE